jgi:hypothetical protein
LPGGSNDDAGRFKARFLLRCQASALTSRDNLDSFATITRSKGYNWRGFHVVKTARAHSSPDPGLKSASDSDDARHDQGESKARRVEQENIRRPAKFLAAHMAPLITGLEGEPPSDRSSPSGPRAVRRGVKSVFVTVVADLRRLPAHCFWNVMAFHGRTHPCDSKGRRRPHSELPRSR